MGSNLFTNVTGVLSMQKEEVVRFLTAIGDPVRLELLSLLFHKGRSNVGDIASNFRLSRPAISHHLKVLKEAGVVEYEKVGQEGFYWLNRAHVAERLREIADGIESFAPGSICNQVD